MKCEGRAVASSWNAVAHGDAREGKWRGNWRMEWVASTLHTTSEHGVSSITTADAHTSAASSRLNWRPRRFKWTRPFRRKTKSGFCACAITFQLASTTEIHTMTTFIASVWARPLSRFACFVYFRVLRAKLMAEPCRNTSLLDIDRGIMAFLGNWHIAIQTTSGVLEGAGWNVGGGEEPSYYSLSRPDI